MEEVIGGVFKFIVRAIVGFFIEFIVEIVIYYLGFGFLKLITFGHYPKSGEKSETVCVSAGILLIVAVILVVALTNSSS